MSSLKMTGKTAAVMIAAVMCLAQGVLAQTQTWECGVDGDNVIATYDNGTLTVSGSGDMAENVGALTSSWLDYGYGDKITTVIIEDGVTSIGGYAFYWCENLTAITLGKDVTSIGDYAFGQSGLTEIIIPNSITSIGDYVFFWCGGLTSITIPNSVKTIGERAFGQSGLTEIIIPNSVTTIKNYAFHGCENLTAVTLGSGVTSIGGMAFAITGLNTINILADNPPAVEVGAFDDSHKTTVNLHVPQGSLADYQAAPVWKDFDNMSEAAAFTVTFDPQTGGQPFTQEVFSGSLALEPPASDRTGYTLDGWYKEASYETKWDFATDEVDEDITLYAKWEIIIYEITWNTNGGLPAPTQTTATIESGITVPAAMTKAEYDFKGWYTDAAFTQAATFPMSDVTENKTFYAKWESNTSVISRDRTPVPPSGNVPLLSVVLAGEFAVGPNPAAKSEGKMSFFWQGNQLENTTLFIYDASGSLVKKITIADKSKTRTDKRAVGSWDLKDAKGRAVSEGSYVVKGAIKTKDGKKDKISLVVGVR